MPKQIRPAKVLSIIQRKGGAGKTTIMHHLAAGLVLHGYEVLAIEADDNPRLRAILAGLQSGQDPDLDPMQTTYGLFAHPELGTDRCAFAVDLNRLWQNVPHLATNDVHLLRSERDWSYSATLDYIPGSEQIKDIEEQFALMAHDRRGFVPDQQLMQALTKARTQYDVIVIDSPPSLTRVLRNVLAASTHVVIPVEFDFASGEDYLRTLGAYRKIVAALRESGIPTPAAPLVVGNKYDASNEDHRIRFEAYTRDHPEVINGRTEARPAIIGPLMATIPYDPALLDRAASQHRSLHQYAPKSEMGRAMFDLVTRAEAALGLA